MFIKFENHHGNLDSLTTKYVNNKAPVPLFQILVFLTLSLNVKNDHSPFSGSYNLDAAFTS